jgi:hypothetical protein
VQTAVRDALRLPNFEQPLKAGENWRPRHFWWLDGNDSWRSPDQRLRVGVVGNESEFRTGNNSRAVIDAHLIAVDVFENAYESGSQQGLTRAQPQAAQQWLDGMSHNAHLAITQAAQTGRYTTADGKTMIVSPDMPTHVLATYDLQINSSNTGPYQLEGLHVPRGTVIKDPTMSPPMGDPRVTIVYPDPRANIPLDDQPDDVIRRRADEARRRRRGED